MLVIRLSRGGKKKQPTYRVVVQEKQRDPWGTSVEIVGNYNPRTSPSTLNLQEDRVQYWLEKGAQPSATVHNLLVNAGLIKADKVRATSHDKKEVDPEAEAPAEEKPAAEAPKAEDPKEEAPAEEPKKEEAPAEEPKEEAPAPEAAEEVKEEPATAVEEEKPAEEAPAEEKPQAEEAVEDEKKEETAA